MLFDRRGIMVALSSPSGAGKTSLASGFLRAFPSLRMSISVTTRAPRQGEKEGEDYFFRTPEAFETLKENGDLLEWAQVYNHAYGTPRKPVEEALSCSQDLLFDVDWQGVQQLKQSMGNDLVSIFLLPPSLTILEQRLRHRGQDKSEVIAERMQKAKDEISHWPEYDYVIVNDNLNEMILKGTHIFEAERLRRTRQRGLARAVEQICSS